MKKILILQGVSDSGKTTILNNLINWLLNYPNQTNNIQTDGTGPDRFGVVEINGFRIGIITQGDEYHYVQKRLLEIHNQDCDVIVCCCRTRLSSLTAVTEFLNTYNNSQLVYLSQWIRVVAPWSTQQSNRVLTELQTWLRGI
ncbi:MULTISPECIES: GTPase [unclassified Leeuwenhoekiella]|uniref:GTPase n=1 Tax=unclassified Leeuwenhoekiella TaxID=2615029 RepID=UPI000C3E7B31|nr:MULTISPECIES: GTPase [unclassified Leeuwenhoekiella]MAW94494.1 hypothetical protein [Leeuwenhoekiella sp.]MAW96990.1 hypothetical protein [Leeuwenhoekiella sp.]MBA81172.1 hypothetical protein [Leeuwenhoekiella sp.]|tara:strand:- start:3287 stop:3712 length:426 start_codon:yes stop_codon:yes gene_type:complete